MRPKRTSSARNFPWLSSATLSSPVIAVKCDNRQVVVLGGDILVRIVEVESKAAHDADELLGVLRFQADQANSAIDKHITDES